MRYKLVEKYEQKLLVWLAISPRGMTQAVFSKSGLAVNQKTYLEKCIKPKLVPFIRENYEKDGFVFWPNLATYHYAN